MNEVEVEVEKEKKDLSKMTIMPIYLSGRIEYEWCLNLRTQLKHLQKNHPNTFFVLDLLELDFIGSSSILHFVEVIKHLHKEGLLLKLTNVQVEFIKVFQLYQLLEVEICPPPIEATPAGTATRSSTKKTKSSGPHLLRTDNEKARN